MYEESVILTCSQCYTKNKVPKKRLPEHPHCGKCHAFLPVAMYVKRLHEVNDGDFSQEVLVSLLPVLVEFYSLRCPYSRQLAPLVEQLAAVYGGQINFVRLNVLTNAMTSGFYRIQGTPTLIIFDNGKEVDRIVGVLSADEIERHLLKFVKKL